jgi:hypothetical protein
MKLADQAPQMQEFMMFVHPFPLAVRQKLLFCFGQLLFEDFKVDGEFRHAVSAGLCRDVPGC